MTTDNPNPPVQAIVKVSDPAALMPVGGYDEIMRLGKALAASGYFADAKDANQAVAKIIAGREMGIGPVAALANIYIVKGRIVISANLMASQVKRSGRYDYKVRQSDNTV